ncbi:MAG: cytochrome C oxidase subunit IV family protein [Cyclobacteriaceae bacterium]|nr:cytochrome C oxidase subunit IV family protein [Cyclobacteriaceae bacterium HetDA_MAG_MS6]
MEEVSQIEVKPVNKEKVKLFVKVTIILAVITAFEFLIAFTVPHEYKWLRIVVFIVLTIFKAYYIVAEFMHLGHEKKSLKLSIVLPMLFIVFLIFILLFQADAILQVLS